MYHIKNNNLIIFDSYLSFRYLIKLDEIIIYSSEKQNFIKQTKLNLVGNYIYNGEVLPEKTKFSLYQKSESLDINGLIEECNSSNFPLELNLEKFENYTIHSIDLIKFLEGLNKYKFDHENLTHKFELLSLNSVKDKLDTILTNIEQKGYIND